MQEKNPFVLNFKLAVLKVNKTYTLVSNGGSKKDQVEGLVSIKGGLQIPMPFLMERTDRTSLFHNQDSMEVLFKQLRSIGRDVLLYIIYNLKKDHDSIVLKADKASENMGISKATLYVGLGQLTDAGVIAKKDVGVYWINPIYIYNGDRIKYFEGLGEDYIDIVATL